MKVTHCYVGVKNCGCRTAVVVDATDQPKFTAQALSEFVREGLTIERESIETFRSVGLERCQHKETQKETQQELAI